MSSSQSLPIWKIHDDILSTLQDGNRLILVAPTGSGKTTQVPQMLRNARVGGDKLIVVLQPRRVAARSVAARVASERDVKLGDEVGYQIRFDDRTTQATRICFVTEGILLRWLQDDRQLSKVGAIVFDEFHERNLLSDVALALVKDLQKEQRPDLAMIVMSATLDAEPVAEYLEHCPVLVSEGQSFPVEVNYLPLPDQNPITWQAADAVGNIINDGDEGDILVFMPGQGEINGTLDALRDLRKEEQIACIPLHGALEPQEQDRAFAPNKLRKVIVATNVAETSITIDGIRHVVDSGVARIARYDAERGIGTLQLEPISQASADQRKGRAGRTAQGTCHRLWTEIGQKSRDERNTPEIQRSDLSEVVLLLHSLGIQKSVNFDWLDKPDSHAVERAEQLLTMLGALINTELTDIGRQMLSLPMHPRYSRMLIEASKRRCIPEAALCAALVSGRDLLARNQDQQIRELFEESDDSDFITLMRAYDFAKETRFNFGRCRSHGINAQVARQVDEIYKQILHSARQQGLCGKSTKPFGDEEALRHCLMAGFIDQLAKRRAPNQPDCDLTEQREGRLVRESVVQDSSYFVSANLHQVASRGPNPLTLLSLATSVEPTWITEMFPQHLSTTLQHIFDPKNKRVTATKQVRFLDLIIEQKAQQNDLDPQASGRCLAEAQQSGSFDLPLMDHRLRQFMARVNLVHAHLPELEFQPFDEAATTQCLALAFKGLTLVKDAQTTPLLYAFHQHLEKGQLSWLDELLPPSLLWQGKRSIKISYLNGIPEAQVKIQDCWSIEEQPTLCEGKLPVTIILCDPKGKKIATTTDWPRFLSKEWKKYRPVLQRKFPGHVWR